MGALQVFRVTVSDGVIRHFSSAVEAQFYADDCTAAGFATMTHPIPCPETPADFCDLLDDTADALRCRTRERR
jgi:hypothetical protein